MTQPINKKGISSLFSFRSESSPFPHSMTDPVDCPYIVRVLSSIDQRFLGTAFFVSPTLAIGCLHYLKLKEPRDSIRDTVTLDWGKGTRQIDGRAEFNDVDRDFAAIRVKNVPNDLTIPAARLAENIDATTLDSLCAPRNLFLKGYLGRESGAFRHQIEIRHKPLVQTEREQSDRPFLRDAQFPGGWTEGLSGSPLLARHAGEWIVLGMAYLGGEKSGNSRVLLADAILELLERECPDEASLKPVPAQQLVKEIQSVGGIEARLGTSVQDRPAMTPTAPARIGRLRHHMTTLVSAFALTLLARMYAYLRGGSLDDTPQLSFLLLVFYAVVLSVRWMWSRIMEARRMRT